MGLIRRVALDELGGWEEWCITEDAELSLRLLRAGWNGLHMDQTWGRGVMPLTFEALKGQRYRWCFGGIQILRMHWRSLLPGRHDRHDRLSLAQRWAYLAGALQWYGVLRRGTGATWRDAVGAFFVWQSTSLVVARASVQGLFARKAAFLRTPKTSEGAPWWEALRANWAE